MYRRPFQHIKKHFAKSPVASLARESQWSSTSRFRGWPFWPGRRSTLTPTVYSNGHPPSRNIEAWFHAFPLPNVRVALTSIIPNCLPNLRVEGRVGGSKWKRVAFGRFDNQPFERNRASSREFQHYFRFRVFSVRPVDSRSRRFLGYVTSSLSMTHIWVMPNVPRHAPASTCGALCTFLVCIAGCIASEAFYFYGLYEKELQPRFFKLRSSCTKTVAYNATLKF